MKAWTRRQWQCAAFAACAAVFLAVAPIGASAQPASQSCGGVVNSQVSALLAKFPTGGPFLRAAIARLIEANPELADAVVFMAHRANPAQKEAIGAGLADAANYFAKCGLDRCRFSEANIRVAMNCADEGTRVGFVIGDTPTLAQGIPGFNNAGAATSRCPAVISPSGPLPPRGC